MKGTRAAVAVAEQKLVGRLGVATAPRAHLRIGFWREAARPLQLARDALSRLFGAQRVLAAVEHLVSGAMVSRAVASRAVASGAMDGEEGHGK